MILGVNLGCATTLGVKIGLKMGWCTTFEIFKCIRWTDIVEPFFVFGIKTIVCATKTNITVWIRCNGSVAAAQTTDQSKIYHNTVLLLYNWERLFGINRGIVYILRTFVRHANRHICSIHKLLVKSAFPKYLIKNHPNNHFDTHFDKTQQNQAFRHFSHHQKSQL